MRFFSNLKSIVGFLLVIFKSRLELAARNRVSIRALLEDYYLGLFRGNDSAPFGDDFFADVGKQLSDKISERRKYVIWCSISEAILLLCLFRVVNNVAILETTIDIKRFSPIVLLFFSGCTLNIAIINVSVIFLESILTAHARNQTRNKLVDLYMTRY